MVCRGQLPYLEMQLIWYVVKLVLLIHSFIYALKTLSRAYDRSVTLLSGDDHMKTNKQNSATLCLSGIQRLAEALSIVIYYNALSLLVTEKHKCYSSTDKEWLQLQLVRWGWPVGLQCPKSSWCPPKRTHRISQNKSRKKTCNCSEDASWD